MSNEYTTRSPALKEVSEATVTGFKGRVYDLAEENARDFARGSGQLQLESSVDCVGEQLAYFLNRQYELSTP